MNFELDDDHLDETTEGFRSLMKKRYAFNGNFEDLLCSRCPGKVPVCFLSNRFPKWCLSLGCSEQHCCRKWHACFVCEDAGKMQCRLKDLESHNLLFHQFPADITMAPARSNEGSISSGTSTTETGDAVSGIEDDIHEFFADQEGWAEFFLHHRKGNALGFLVSNQFLDSPDPSCVSTADAELHVLIAAHCSNLTKGERQQFSEILRRISEMNRNDHNNGTGIINRHFHCKVPESRLELLQYVEGKKPILRNIPVPLIHSASNGDAYVRLPDVLKLYLSFGLKPSTVRYVNETGAVGRDGVTEDIWKSPHAKKQLQSIVDRNNNSLKGALVKWSDGCDPNSGSKGNRGSVHVCTVTLFAGENNNPNFTFLIHVGREDTSHYEVNKALLQDLQFLRVPKLYYDGDNFDTYQFLEFATIHDRPELSKECGFGYHSGTLTPRFPHSCPVTDNLPSRDGCYDRRLRLKTSYKSNHSCDQCHDWSFDEVVYNPPDGYPVTSSKEKLNSRQLTFDDMMEAAVEAHNKIISKQWSKNNALKYMQTWGINGNVANDIVKNSEKETPDTVNNIVPPVWTAGKDTDLYIAAVMHLVFLGVTKTVGMMVRDLLIRYGAWPTFFKETQAYLNDLKGYSLAFCRVWTMGSHDKPFSPWVSENYLAHARCFKMTYSFLTCIKKNDDEEREEAVRLAQTTTHSWVAVVARLMQKPSDRNNNHSAERHIKLFLSNLDKLDEHIMAKKEDNPRAKQQKKRKFKPYPILLGF